MTRPRQAGKHTPPNRCQSSKTCNEWALAQNRSVSDGAQLAFFVFKCGAAHEKEAKLRPNPTTINGPNTIPPPPPPPELIRCLLIRCGSGGAASLFAGRVYVRLAPEQRGRARAAATPAPCISRAQSRRRARTWWRRAPRLRRAPIPVPNQRTPHVLEGAPSSAWAGAGACSRQPETRAPPRVP